MSCCPGPSEFVPTPESEITFAPTLAAAINLFPAPVTVPNNLSLIVSCRATVGDGYGGVFVYDSSDSTSTFTLSGLGFVDNVGRRWKRIYQGIINLQWFGAIGNGSFDNTSIITAVLGLLGTMGGGTIFAPAGTYLDSGTRTLPPRTNIVGAGMGVTYFNGTNTTNPQFNMPASSENVIDYGGNYFYGFTCLGVGITNTASAFKIKNKVNLKFDHVEFDNYNCLVQGVRDNAANSVDDISFAACRFGRCKHAILALNAWNSFDVDRACSFSSFDDWAIICYDSTGVTIAGSFDGNPTTSGAGHAFFGGVNGFVVTSRFEGTPNTNSFCRFASQKAVDGTGSANGIAIGTSRGGSCVGISGSSGSGLAYVINIDGMESLVCTGCNGGSGISTAFAFLTTGTRGNTFIGCFPNPGLVADFQSAADIPYNLVADPQLANLPQAAIAFTPVVTGASGAGTATYSLQRCGYWRDGPGWRFNMILSWTSHTGTGQMQISIPQAASQYATFAVRPGVLSAGDTTQVIAYVAPSASIMLFEHYAAGAVNPVNVPATGSVIVSGFYEG